VIEGATTLALLLRWDAILIRLHTGALTHPLLKLHGIPRSIFKSVRLAAFSKKVLSCDSLAELRIHLLRNEL
jgi:hypothetical protein